MDESLSDFKSGEEMAQFISSFGKKFKFYNENNSLISVQKEDSISISEISKIKKGTRWNQIFIDLEEE